MSGVHEREHSAVRQYLETIRQCKHQPFRGLTIAFSDGAYSFSYIVVVQKPIFCLISLRIPRLISREPRSIGIILISAFRASIPQILSR
jgi:hypothetical protein